MVIVFAMLTGLFAPTVNGLEAPGLPDLPTESETPALTPTASQEENRTVPHGAAEVNVLDAFLFDDDPESEMDRWDAFTWQNGTDPSAPGRLEAWELQFETAQPVDPGNAFGTIRVVKVEDRVWQLSEAPDGVGLACVPGCSLDSAHTFTLTGIDIESENIHAEDAFTVSLLFDIHQDEPAGLQPLVPEDGVTFSGPAPVGRVEETGPAEEFPGTELSVVGPADEFTWTCTGEGEDPPLVRTVGSAFGCSLGVLDTAGQVHPFYNGTVTFTTTAQTSPDGFDPLLDALDGSGAGPFPSDYNFTLDDAGQRDFNVTFFRAEEGVNVTADDTGGVPAGVEPLVNATTEQIDVEPADPASFLIGCAPDDAEPRVVNTSVACSVQEGSWQDPFGNPSGDGPDANLTITNDLGNDLDPQGTNAFTLPTSIERTVAVDHADARNESSYVLVPDVLEDFAVLCSPAPAPVATEIACEATDGVDRFGNPVVLEDAEWSVEDVHGDPVTNGTGLMTTFLSPEDVGDGPLSVEVTAQDEHANPAANATSIDLLAGDAALFEVDCGTEHVAGVPFDCEITALDDHGNQATGYNGTVAFSTTAGPSPNEDAPDLPAQYTFTEADEGNATISGFVLYNAESGVNITATDNDVAGVTGTQQGIAVEPADAAALHFDVAPPAQAVVTVAWDSFTVKVVDAFGNHVDAQVEVDLEATGGATESLQGTTTRTTQDGIATFDSIHYNAVENITVTAGSEGLDGVESAGIEVGPLFLLTVEPQHGFFAPGNTDARLDHRSIAITVDLEEEALLWVRVLEGEPGETTTPTKIIMNGAERGPGTVDLAWDGRNQASQSVPEGPYTLAVEAGDPDTGSTITHLHDTALRIDRTAPSFDGEVPAPEVFTEGASVTLTITADEPLHPEDDELEGSALQPGCGSAGLVDVTRINETTYEADYTVRGPDDSCTDGLVDVTISGRDRATIPGETTLVGSFEADFTSPDSPTLILVNAQAPDPDLANGTGEPEASVHVCAVYSLGGIGDPDACDPVETAGVGADGEWGPVEIPRIDGEGAVQVCASQEDLSGNLGDETCLGLDNLPPEVTQITFLDDPLRSNGTGIPGGPSGTEVTFVVDKDTWYTVEVRDADNQSLRTIPLGDECELDGGECFADEFDPASFHFNGTDDTDAPVDDGPYTVCVTARDVHHNSATTCSGTSVEVDNTPPTIDLVGWSVVGDKRAAGDTDAITLTLNASEPLDAAPTVSVGGDDAPCTGTGTGFTCDYTAMGPSGVKEVVMEGRDLAGNDGTSTDTDSGPVVDVDAPEFIDFNITMKRPGMEDEVSGNISENDPGLGNEDREIVLQLHGMALGCGISEATQFGDPVVLTTADASFGSLGVGDNLFPFVRATLTDEAGNVAVSDCRNNDIAPPGIIEIEEFVRSQDPADPDSFVELEVPPTPRIISPGADDDPDNPNPSPGVKNFYKLEFNLTQEAFLTWEAFSGPDCSQEFDFGEAIDSQWFDAGTKELFFSGVLDGANPPNGEFCLFLTAEDEAGNDKTVTRKVTVDNTVPVFDGFAVTEMRDPAAVPLSAHEDGVFYLNEGELDLRFCVDKTLDGLPSVELETDSGSLSPITGPGGDRCYAATIEVDAGDVDGLYSFVAKGTDLAGNPNDAFDPALTDSADFDVRYQIDQTSPTVSDTTEAADRVIQAGQTVPIRATCTDASPVEVHAVIAGTTHQMAFDDGTNEYEFDFEHDGLVANAPLADTLEYHVECVDAAANEADTTADAHEIEVSPGDLVSIDISPDSLPEVQVTDTQEFSATGHDAFGNDVGLDSVADCTWDVADDDLGSFTANVLTAGTTTGVYSQGVQVECLGVSEALTVLVTPGDTASIEVTHEQDGEPTTDPSDVPAGTTLDLTAVPRDEFGNEVFNETTTLTDEPVLGFGWNHRGQIGDGEKPFREDPGDVLNVENAVEVSSGFSHALALMENGTVMTWGENRNGQLGMGDQDHRLVPTTMPGLENVTGVSAGTRFSLAVLDNGTVLAWGSGGSGRLGHDDFDDRFVPTVVPGISDAVAVSAGGSHSLALLEDGRVLAWGSNFRGVLGDGTTTTRASPEETLGISEAVGISAGSGHSHVVLENGSMMAWGINNRGQLGVGDEDDRHEPTLVLAITNAIEASAGSSHSLALLDNGTVMSWGWGGSGRTGHGDFSDRNEPEQVPGIADAASVSAGNAHSLTMLEDGTVLAWGQNREGQLGLGHTNTETSPVLVPGISDGVHVSAGIAFSLALRADGSVSAWGNNLDGTLGDGTFAERHEPVEALGADGAVQVSGQNDFSLALMEDGSVMSWGSGSGGRLGHGDTVTRYSPERIAGVEDVVQVGAGRLHSLVLLEDGSVLAWGHGPDGQLGDGSGSFLSSSPVEVSDITSAIQVSAGSRHSLALLDNGTIMAWGANNAGELGLGDNDERLEPVAVPGISDAVHVSAGDRFTLAVLGNGTVMAWGSGSNGKLGHGTHSSTDSPVQVIGLDDAVAVSAGLDHSLALLENGTVMAWGSGDNGAHGLGDEEDRFEPESVPGLTTVTAVSAGWDNNMALLDDGRVMVWGNNHRGQLGLGDVTNRLVPTESGLTGIIAISAGNTYSLVAKSEPRILDLIEWTVHEDPEGPIGSVDPANGAEVDFAAREAPVSVASEGRDVTACTPDGVCGSVNLTVVAGPLDQVVLENPDGDTDPYEHVVDETETYTATALDAFGNDVGAGCVFSTSTTDGGTLGSMDSATGELRARTKTQTITFDGTGEVHVECTLDGVSRSDSLEVTLVPDVADHVHALLGTSEVSGVAVASDENLSFGRVVHDRFHNERPEDAASCTFTGSDYVNSEGLFDPQSAEPNLEAGDSETLKVECNTAPLVETEVTVTIGPGGLRGVDLVLDEDDEGLNNDVGDAKVRPGVAFHLNATALDKDDQPVPESDVDFTWNRTHEETGAVVDLAKTEAHINETANLTAGTYRYCVHAGQENGEFTACGTLLVLEPQISVDEPLSDFTDTNAINPLAPSGDFVRIPFELDRDIDLTVEMMDNGDVARDLFLGAPQPFNESRHEVEWDGTDDTSADFLPDGDYRVKVCAVDDDGNEACNDSRIVVLDSVAPNLTLSRNGDPLPEVHGEGSFALRIEADGPLHHDAQEPKVHVEFADGSDDEPSATATDSLQWEATVEIPAGTDGVAGINVTAEDRARNEGSATHSFIVDTIDPDFVDLPGGFTVVAGEPGTIEVTSSDATPVEASFQFASGIDCEPGSLLVNGTSDGFEEEVTFRCDLPTLTTVADETTTFTVLLADAGGNTNLSQSIDLTVLPGPLDQIGVHDDLGDPPEVSADDAQDGIVLRLQGEDEFGNAVSQPVEMTATLQTQPSGEGDLLAADCATGDELPDLEPGEPGITVETDSGGEACVRLILSTTAGTEHVVTAESQVDDQTVQGDSRTIVTVPGDPDSVEMGSLPDELSADDANREEGDPPGSGFTVGATVRDQFENRVADETMVTFSAQDHGEPNAAPLPSDVSCGTLEGECNVVFDLSTSAGDAYNFTGASGLVTSDPSGPVTVVPGVHDHTVVDPEDAGEVSSDDTVQFDAVGRDQFGNAIDPSDLPEIPVWEVEEDPDGRPENDHEIDTTGMFTAGSKDGTFSVAGTIDGKAGTSTVTVRPMSISDVFADPDPFHPLTQPGHEDTTRIHYTMDREATVWINITKDGDLVREVVKGSVRDAGENSAVWDGLDVAANFVDPGTYRIEIEAEDTSIFEARDVHVDATVTVAD